MTTHEADRRADHDPVADNEDLPGHDDPSAEPHSEAEADVGEAGVADAEMVEPEEHEPETTWSPEHDTGHAHSDEPRTDPVERLAPAGSDTALDPGTGSYPDRWDAIQAGFIDDPRRTVESAGALVAEIWDEIARGITDEREGVDDRWQSTDTSTDDFRAAMQDYRTLYTRLMHFTSH
jgi:hypothetical protein